MGELTRIAWAHSTFNPWVGCEKVSAECDHCYAESGSARLGAQHRLKLWAGDRYFTGEDYWKQPPRWNRAAEKAGERRRVFCASFSDVGERRDDLVDRRRRLQHLIVGTPWLDWLLLSKRPENLVELFGSLWPHEWPGNVWAGTTVGVRSSLHRIDQLRGVPARVRFVSAEPLLEDLGELSLRAIDWCIIGGESGPKARPYDLAWARRLIRQCAEWPGRRVACFHKQLGSRPFDSEGPVAFGVRITEVVTVHPKGEDPSEWPDDLRARECPS